MKNNGIIFKNAKTGEYLAWCEMQPIWVSDVNNAFIETDPYQLLVDIITLQRQNINFSDYIMIYVMDGKVTRIVKLDNYYSHVF